MSETEGIQRVESPFGASSSAIPKQHHQQSVCLNHLDIPKLNTAQFRAQIRQFFPNSNTEHSSKRVGIPSSHPQIPPLLPYSTRIPESVPLLKTHRRSNSDIPFGFSTILQSSPPLIPLRTLNSLDRSASLKDSPGSKAVQFVKSEGEVVDDLFSYMNVDNFDKLNSSRAENCEDLGSRASVTKVNGGDSSDNEATSSVHENGDIAPTRHYRSMSMDSVMLKMNFADELPTLPPNGGQNGQISLVDASMNTNTFSLEFGNGEFTAVELKKIMANEKLVEIALTDPKRVKRILANRQSAARSKERKMHYITELEHKVQTLQTEITTLSAQHTLLQRDLAGLTSQNNELKFRLQATEQQAQLRDALNEALTAEVQCWKITNAELSGDANKFYQLSGNYRMLDLHHQQNNGATNTITHE